MTARYPYIQDMHPPAPFVHVTLRVPVGEKEMVNQPAQLDTGADRTVLPWSAVESLGLVQLDTILIGGFDGVQQPVPTFGVMLGLRQFPPFLIEVVASKAEKWVLLGRDVLNRHRLLLDGPQLTTEVG